MSCGASHNLGVELGVTALATPWLDLGASYTFLGHRITGEAQLRPLDRLGPLRRRDPVRQLGWLSVGVSVTGCGPGPDAAP